MIVRITLPIAKGKKKGVEALHFKCNYCKSAYVGPSNSSFANHLFKEHPKKCADLIASKQPKAKNLKRKFFEKVEMKGPFNVDIFMGKLLKWIV